MKFLGDVYLEDIYTEEGDLTKEFRNEITPQSFESNDGRVSLSIADDGYLELKIGSLPCDHEGYCQEDQDWRQEVEFAYEDLELIIKILERGREINPHSLHSLKKMRKDGE